MSNPCIATDSYKLSHYKQYPLNTTHILSHVVARGTNIVGVKDTVAIGLQPFIEDILMRRVTMADVDAAEKMVTEHGFEFNRADWERIVKEHNGILPVKINAVPEGTVVPMGNAIVTVENTDPTMAWTVSYIETLLLSYLWYGSTVATLSREIKKIIKGYLEVTSDNPEAELPFKLHDFGYRGVAAGAAGLGGMAHLVNFMGTDTIAGIEFAQKYYDAGVCGYSIPASEHSTMTSWGEPNEYEAYKNMVKQYAKPGAIFACVIDSYDIDEAILMWADKIDPETGLTLLEQVREAGATVVLRPDSGDAVATPIKVIQDLMDLVGYEENSKGFKVLPKYVRVIQGDGIDLMDVQKILTQMTQFKISASNIAFGMGGGLLQKVNRDTFKYAMKACAAVIDGKEIDVRKHPSGDPSKASMAGWLTLIHNPKTGHYKTIRREALVGLEAGWYRAHVTVFEHYGNNTKFVRSNFNQVRARAEVR